MKRIIKKFLPVEAVRKMAFAKNKLDAIWVGFFSKSGFLASFYYCFFSTRFYREHVAVLSGRHEYACSLGEPSKSYALLRRNIHRLEKGIIMRPRKSVFAENYIGETVECYLHALRGGNLDSGEKLWAEDVLKKYFSLVGSSEKVDPYRELFLKECSSRDDVVCVPYSYSELPDSLITYDQLYALYRRRRSVRWFDQKKVPLALIRKSVDAATLAPSACNRQPFRFIVIEGYEKASEVAKYAMGTSGFAENIPCLIAVIGDLSSYPAERDRHVIYIDASLAAMQLMLAFETLGLSSCPINWPDVEERELLLSRRLGLKVYERNIMFIAVGYADPSGGIPYSQKKTSDMLVEEAI